MSLDDWHLVFVSVSMVLVLAACAPVTMAYLPKGEEPFMELAVLGEGGMAEHYYPSDDPNIDIGEEIRWTVYLYNHMGETQYIAVRVKLLNSTMSAPNQTSCTPSGALVVYEFRRVLLDNETLLYPFSWSIEDIEKAGNLLNIEILSVNGENIKVQVLAEEGYNYRVILELWVFDEILDDFRFGWSYGEEIRCAWNQIWFNATSTVG